MTSAEQEASTPKEPRQERYSPPAVEWEEEFAPLADSPFQCPSGNPDDC